VCRMHLLPLLPHHGCHEVLRKVGREERVVSQSASQGQEERRMRPKRLAKIDKWRAGPEGKALTKG
jgi:hypothetical protein